MYLIPNIEVVHSALSDALDQNLVVRVNGKRVADVLDAAAGNSKHLLVVFEDFSLKLFKDVVSVSKQEIVLSDSLKIEDNSVVTIAQVADTVVSTSVTTSIKTTIGDITVFDDLFEDFKDVIAVEHPVALDAYNKV